MLLGILIFMSGLFCFPLTSHSKVSEEPTDTSSTESKLIHVKDEMIRTCKR